MESLEQQIEENVEATAYGDESTSMDGVIVEQSGEQVANVPEDEPALVDEAEVRKFQSM